MANADVLTLLQALEEEMHQHAVRCDTSRMETLLHPEFEEVGRSGRTYTRAQVLQDSDERAQLPKIVAEKYKLQALGSKIWLLRYSSSQLSESGTTHRATLRTSIWIETDSGFQLRFHQGTPADDKR